MARKKVSFKASVKKFTSFACRTGDLVHEGPAGPTAAEGQKAHRKLQSLRSANEKAEAKVSASIIVDDAVLLLSGRVDLLDDNPTAPAISEIKSCYAPPDKIPQSTTRLHWAQLKIYGYCFLQQLSGDDKDTAARTITLKLVWFNIVTDKVTVDTRQFSTDELGDFATNAATRYLHWMKKIHEHRLQVEQSSLALNFPFDDFRAGQRQMAAGVYVTARDKGALLCEAPTGIGKTISALFPAVKAVGEKHIESVVYLTAKNSGRTAANDSLLKLQSAGLIVSAITITSKKTSCHCSNGTCERNSDGRCPLTVGFFDRLPEARQQLMTQGVITPAAIDQAAHSYQLCPFELTLQMLPWVTLVICDYNYVFDPLVKLTHFSEKASRQLLLIDEAHNLIDRARSMYSARLDQQLIKKAIDDNNDQTGLLVAQLKRVNNAIKRRAANTDETESQDTGTPATITKAVNKCTEALTALVENNTAMTEPVADLAKELYRYLVIEDLFGDQHRTITLKTKYKRTTQIKVKLQCLNATTWLQHSFKQFRGCVAFSATLRPQHFFRQSLGLPDHTACLVLPSPFNPHLQGSFLCDWVDTRYQARERALVPIADIAYQIYSARRGNYQIFFPSYVFMEKVYACFARKYPDVPTIIQQRASTEAERKEFLATFDADDATLAFAILGGVFGEGVDYIGEKLIGSIIVGTGLASIGLEQKLIEQDYATQNLNGFDYASRYPGFTRVLQTAGRVIRSETDKGVVILIDQRFSDSFYTDLFPQHWSLITCRNTAELSRELEGFWSGQQQIF